MKRFRCPKCTNDTVVETIEHVTEYRVFWRIDQDGYSPDYQDYEYDYNGAETLDYTCEGCGFWLGTDLDDVIDKHFKEDGDEEVD